MSSKSSAKRIMPTDSPATSAGNKALDRLKNWPGEHKAAVGLSGGVDSSLTAALLVEAGWQVEGLTLWIMRGKGSCCSDGLIDAAGVCQQIGVLHHVVDARSTFEEEVIQRVVQDYEDGITPLPCSRCNRSVKFAEMLKWAAKERALNRIATGHYARIRYANESENFHIIPGDSLGRNKLLRGLDRNKDQSYFLYDLPQEILEKIIFPLGELTKKETRSEANRFNLRTANKPESQDLCLAEHYGSMKAFLEAYIPLKEGEIVLQNGTVIGKHNGIQNFTIGQRKGLGVSWQEPLHVVRLDQTMNRVVVAPRSGAGQSSCIVGSVNWISIAPPNTTINAEVQVRYRSRPLEAEIVPMKANSDDLASNRPHRCRINFHEEQFSITPGQAAVFYSGEVVLGGGLIERPITT